MGESGERGGVCELWTVVMVQGAGWGRPVMGWLALLLGLVWMMVFLVVFVVLHWLFLQRVLGARGVWLWLGWPAICILVGVVTYWGCELVLALLNGKGWFHAPRFAMWGYGVRSLYEYGYLMVRGMVVTYPLTLVTMWAVRWWYEE